MSTLILDSSGGAGHQSVANVLQRRETDSEVKIGRKDVMKDFFGVTIAAWIAGPWNNAQKNGDIARQEQLASKQWLADKIFAIPIFFRTLLALFSMEEPPEKVINTQVMSIGAIVRAIQFYNLIQKRRNPEARPVKMECWLTDFVSERANHFIRPLSELDHSQKELVDVYVPNNLEGFKEAAGYVGEHLVGKVHLIKRSELPVAEIFRDKELLGPGLEVDLKLKLTESQANLISPCLGDKNGTKPLVGNGAEDYSYHVEAKDRVCSMMLGSQPTKKVVKESVQQMIDMARKNEGSEPMHFFVFCGKDEGSSPSLFKEVCAELKAEAKEAGLPKQLSIIPLPFQDPSQIAKIMARSDAAFTRAGGATCFEHVAMQDTLGPDVAAKRKICIVAEVADAEFKKLGENPILSKKIPVWEGGNAEVLKEMVGAEIIAAQNFGVQIKSLFFKAETSVSPKS